MANKLGRDGRVEKRLGEIKPHTGMRFKTSVDGQSFVAVGISKTELGHMVESGGKPIHEPNPNIEKTIYKIGAPPTYPGHRSRTGVSVDGGAILREASGIVDHNAPGAVKAVRK
jgi:hypothetical protein